MFEKGKKFHFTRRFWGATVTLFFILCSSSYGFIKSDANNDGRYKVIRMFPHTEEELAIVKALYDRSSDLQLNFWKAPTIAGAFADVMAEPDVAKPLIRFLQDRRISHTVTIDDVERLTVEREGTRQRDTPSTTVNPLLESFLKRVKDFTTRNKAKYGFGDYHSYNEIIRWLNDIERYYPDMASVFTIGTTHEGRYIQGIKIGNPIHRTDKRIVWIDGGMHAREWAAVHTALYFIEQLIAQYGVDPQITSYVDTLNFYIVPVANPDGFEYSRSDITPQTRFWRKNRGQQVCTKDHWKRERCCGGVDLNRNFDFHWGESGSSSDMCSEIYQGVAPFSEPEARAIRDKLLSPELYGKVDAFITLHTYSQMWIHPFNHQRRSFPNDINDLEDVGKRGVKALEGVYGTKFRFGTGADILYPSAGGSDDWAKAKASVKYVYLLELRPGEEEWDGFLLDKRQLIPTGRETWAGVRVVIDAVMKAQRTVAPGISPNSIQALQVNEHQNKIILNPPLKAQTPQISQPTAPRRLGISQQIPKIQSTRDQRQRTNVQRRFEVLELLRAREANARREFELRSRTPTANSFPGFCIDRSPWCLNWIRASPDVCQTSTMYMRQDCARSCRYCV